MSNPRQYACPRGHRFVEGTTDYDVMMTLDVNHRMRRPLKCSTCDDRTNLRLVDEPLQEVVTRPAKGLLLLACDVSGSMFFGANRAPVDKAKQVAAALASTLRPLAMSGASASKYLLIGMVVFAERAAWVDFSGAQVRFAAQPCVASVGEVVGHGLAGGPALGADHKAEQAHFAAALLRVLDDGKTHCGGERTNYEAALVACRLGLTMARDAASRKALRADWEELFVDPIGTYLRTFFYSDGDPNVGATDPAALGQLCTQIFPDRNTPLMTASFMSPGADETLMMGMSSACPVHVETRCMFPGERAVEFREIIKMASGGAGFCPRCLDPRMGRA